MGVQSRRRFYQVLSILENREETVVEEKKYELNDDQLEQMAGGAAYKEESVPAAGCLRRFIKGRSYVL